METNTENKKVSVDLEKLQHELFKAFNDVDSTDFLFNPVNSWIYVKSQKGQIF